MQLLDKAGLAELKRRFGTFHDALLRSVEYKPDFNGDGSMFLTIDVIELPWVLDESGSGYLLDLKRMLIEVRDLEAYCFRQLPNYESMTIFGISLEIGAEFSSIDLDNNGDPHSETSDWMLRHQRWALGREIWWDIQPLPANSHPWQC
jgi:hypothetical protein